MSIEVICPQCNTGHHVNDRMAGRRVRCPKCDTSVQVPEAAILIEDTTAEPLEVTAEVDPFEDEIPVEVGQPVIASEKSAFDAGMLAAFSEIKTAANNSAPVAEAEDDEEADQVLVRNKRPEEEMDMTPMVDVTFLLLIFFMVTAAFSLQKSIVMPRQQTDAPSTSVIEEETDELDMVEIQVDEFGSFLVMAPEWERETPGKQNLISTLKEAMGSNNDGMRLVIKVHEMAKLHALVDAMDAGTIAGYAQLEVTQVEDFD